MQPAIKAIPENDYKNSAQPTLSILGTNIWNGSLGGAVEWIMQRVKSRRNTQIAFANANNLNIACEKPELLAHLDKSHRVFADGSGIRLAARLMGKRVIDNVNGTDMFPLLCEALAKGRSRVYFLGAEKSVLESMIEKLQYDYPELKIVGFHHGFILNNDIQQRKVIQDINLSNADILLVAMGTPTQENWLSKFSNQLKVPVKMSVGGLFDFFGNKVSRAPRVMRRLGIEWVWRTLQEPKRMWRRYILGNPLFIYRVITAHSVKIIKDRLIKRSFITEYLKRGFDMLVAISMLFLLLPLLLLVSAAIKVESKGPVFFSQKRVGKHGREFLFWKFRSMVVDASMKKNELAELNESSDRVLFKIKKDPRVTWVGKIIRRFSVDELPQLWNVILGDMHLVGPRPALPEEVALYSSNDRKRLQVKPGITCFWQVNGRSELSFKQQVVLDLKYINERSFYTDFKILLQTIPAVISGKGAC